MRTGEAVRRLLAATSVVGLTASLCLAGPHRYARSGEFTGAPEIEVHAFDPWRPAERNLPLVESSRVRTAGHDQLEVELDDGSAFRLSGDALAEISDYAQLSTGQRITLIAVDHGIVYFSGEPQVHDTLSLVAPGMQLILRAGSRLRIEAEEHSTTVAVMEGAVRFTTPEAEMDLHAGQYARVDPDAPARFTLLRQIPRLEADAWSEGRDKATAHSTAAAYMASVRYGLADLDRHGAWVQTENSGAVWKPRTEDDWRPFRDGRWEWYDEAGYTWIAAEPWGWMPYHYGRWLQDSSLGWVWSPDVRPHPIYKPGDVYWLRGAGRVAWGPLAPGETWSGAARSDLYAAANTTFAPLLSGQKQIDPSLFDPKLAAKPAEALAGMCFTLSPLSPALAAARFEAQRPELRSAEQHAPLVTVAPEVPAAAYEPPQPVQSPAPPPILTASTDSATPPTGDNLASMEPQESYYPVAVYTGVVVIDPPLRPAAPAEFASGATSPSKHPAEPVHPHPPERVDPIPPPERRPDGDARSTQ